MASQLTGKQRKFAIEYVRCLNATEAARRAGYAGNDVTLGAVGYENLRKPQIKAFIDEEFSRDIMSAHEVLYNLTMIARGDIDDVVDSKGNLSLLRAQQRGKTGLIKSVKSRAITTDDSDIVEMEVSVYDKLKALDMLAKYHDLINRVRITSWQDEVVALLKDGTVTPEEVEAELGKSLAEQLFIAAGVPIATG